MTPEQSPERNLYWATLCRAYLDLAGQTGLRFHAPGEHTNAMDQAFSFFFSESGGWATSRRAIAAMLDIDEGRLIAAARNVIVEGVNKRVERGLTNG